MIIRNAFTRCFIYLIILVSVAGNFYKFSAKDIDGRMIQLSDFAGKVVNSFTVFVRTVCFFLQLSLVVNVASECGYTESNYEGLVDMQLRYERHDFTVLAFPCNQFGQQEPGSDSNIKTFVNRIYDVNFPLFSKIDVTGPNAHPIYQHLAKETGEVPTWNFAKYLINRSGKVVKFFDTRMDLKKVEAHIGHLLRERDEF
eukprot:m.20201 g.20201  ORF g.20201 m.20201 type:complete len:199 (+) comp27989_c0_seq3:156-752(+)